MARRDPWPFIGLVAFFALLFVALFGERLAPHESIYFVVEHGRDPRPYDPGLVFPFGSDVLGRDLFSVVLAGARTTLGIVVLGGLARVAAGLVLAVAASLSPGVRATADAISEIVAAVPATLVVLLVVLVFVRGETTFLVFVGALLVTGWAGPYRVLRAEVDRLGHMAFTESAAAIGASRLRVAARHHLPHLVPMLAVNLSQQTVASLVALAELGVLGVFVGTYRHISVGASMSFVPVGIRADAFIADPPEWGGLLANGRDPEALWTTRWVFLVPGVAFALASVLVAAVGLGLARRYARRNLLDDLRGRGAAALSVAAIVLVVVAALVPERYAEARAWAADARASVAHVDDLERSFAAAGLAAVGGSYTVERDVERIAQTAPATARVGDAAVSESSSGPLDVLALLFRDSGGGRVEAPLVFASWGLSPSDHRPAPILGFPDLGTVIADWPDDYGAVDVRGKIAVVLRPLRVSIGRRVVAGPDADTHISDVLKRGPAAVIYVDPDLPRFPRVPTRTFPNPYTRLVTARPVERVDGPPVIVLSPAAADRLLAPAGIRPSEIYGALPGGDISTATDYAKHSAARVLGLRAEVSVPAAIERAHVRSVVGAVPGAPRGARRVVVWAVLPTGEPGSAGAADVVAGLARMLARRAVPVTLVAFDPAIDPDGNAALVADRLGAGSLSLVVVLDGLTGHRLHVSTRNGDLIPALDLYAERAGARHAPTLGTAGDSFEWPGIRPFLDVRSVLITGDTGAGDLRGDAAATVGYLVGRLALGAEEVPR